MKIYVIAFLAGCVLTMILGKICAGGLRKLKAGQEIRQEVPTWHNSKAEPHLWADCLYSGSGIVTLCLRLAADDGGNFAHLYVYLCPDFPTHRLCGRLPQGAPAPERGPDPPLEKSALAASLARRWCSCAWMRYEGLLTNHPTFPLST